MADYKTIRGTATFEYEEKRSRFIATASFVDTEEKALAAIWEKPRLYLDSTRVTVREVE